MKAASAEERATAVVEESAEEVAEIRTESDARWHGIDREGKKEVEEQIGDGGQLGRKWRRWSLFLQVGRGCTKAGSTSVYRISSRSISSAEDTGKAVAFALSKRTRKGGG
jgi:hypothetical protein